MSRYRCLGLSVALLLLGLVGCSKSATPVPEPEEDASGPSVQTLPEIPIHPSLSSAAPETTPAAMPPIRPAPASSDLLPGEPPVPKGFATSDDAMLAATTGQVPVIQQPAVPDEVKEIRDIEFCKVNGKSLLLDLYHRKDLDQPAPLMVFVHGGGWSGGDRSIYKVYCVPFALKGYVTAATSYRFSEEAKFPAALQDVKCAIKYLRAHADEYHIDPNRVVLVGSSAGAHLALMAAYTADMPEFEPGAGSPNASSAVQAVVDFYGPTNVSSRYASEAEDLADFLGKKYDEAPELYAQASPVTHLTPDDPPTLIFHGTVDDNVPVSQSDFLDVKLAELGIPHRYERYEGWPHSMDLAAPVNTRAIWVMEQFLVEHLPQPGQEMPETEATAASAAE